MIDTDRTVRLVEGKQDQFFAVADRIWELAETRWQKHASMPYVCAIPDDVVPPCSRG
jgi:hypothetical protein